MNDASFLGSLSTRLSREQPARPVPRESAAVAVIFDRSDEEEKVLLIRRAEREGDPWSGQVAFPGGMVDVADATFQETARREAAEEVGVDLAPGGAVFMGYMGELKARMREIVVVPSVFKLDARPVVTTNTEVASYEWVPLRSLATKEAHSTYLLRRGAVEVPFPSLVHHGMVIWGLTERILSAVIEGKKAQDEGGVLGRIERY